VHVLDPSVPRGVGIFFPDIKIFGDLPEHAHTGVLKFIAKIFNSRYVELFGWAIFAALLGN
jgi:hypothetical protein